MDLFLSIFSTIIFFCAMSSKQGLAHASLGNVSQALEFQSLFEASKAKVDRDFPLRRTHNITSSQALEVAAKMLQGEILFRQGQIACL
jgi:hypothetical protein